MSPSWTPLYNPIFPNSSRAFIGRSDIEQGKQTDYSDFVDAIKKARSDARVHALASVNTTRLRFHDGQTVSAASVRGFSVSDHRQPIQFPMDRIPFSEADMEKLRNLPADDPGPSGATLEWSPFDG